MSSKVNDSKAAENWLRISVELSKELTSMDIKLPLRFSMVEWSLIAQAAGRESVTVEKFLERTIRECLPDLMNG